MTVAEGVLLVYDEAAAAGDEASRDVFDQLDAIEAVLRDRAIACERFGAGLDLGALGRRVAARRPEVVFNLAESVNGSDRLQTLIPMVLEDWRIPFTGCGSAAMLLANDKIASKRALAARGLPVPEGVWLDAAGRPATLAEAGGIADGGDWIVKAAESHASLFLDDSSVLVNAAADEVVRRVAAESTRRGQRFFAERFVGGREFNISLLEDGGEVRVLPPAEIRFDTLPADRVKIVGYAAKWAEESEEYAGTVRTFDFAPGDAGLLAEVCGLARRVWDAMALSGYARVDFRVDEAGRPFILEVNVNPCLTPGAGFAAAAERGGQDYAALIMSLLGVAGAYRSR